MFLFASLSPASFFLPCQLQAEWNLFCLCIPLHLTSGLILMLNYFSFANDVARLQSAHLNMYGDSKERTGFMEMRLHGCRFRSHSLLHY